jgi:hypothetical protein
MTLAIMTLGKITLGIRTLDQMTFSIVRPWQNDTRQYDGKHFNINGTLIITTLSILCHFVQCHYAESLIFYCYAEYYCAQIHIFIVVLSIDML